MVTYSQSDLLRFMQFLVRLEDKGGLSYYEIRTIASLSTVASRCLTNQETFEYVFGLEFYTIYSREEIRKALFELPFTDLPKHIHGNTMISSLVTWRLENGI